VVEGYPTIGETIKEGLKVNNLFICVITSVRDFMSIRDKTNLKYIRRDNPHLISWFCEDELGLNLLLNN